MAVVHALARGNASVVTRKISWPDDSICVAIPLNR